MGTRHLIVVILNKEAKVAQYGQFDGYPSGAGAGVLDFLQKADIPKFRKAVSECSKITDEDYRQSWIDCGAKPGEEFVSLAVERIHAERYSHLSRECSFKVLDLVYNGKARKLSLQEDFAADSLFCEYAYVVDLDKNVLEVYKGFQAKPHSKGRYAGLKVEKAKEGRNQYYPVALTRRFKLDNLPTEEKFLKSLGGRRAA
jgi:hypothetical protein